MVSQNLEPHLKKKRFFPLKKKLRKTMPRALDVVHTSSSAALFAIFLRCLLFTSHGPSWWCSRDKFRGTESGGATTTRPTGGKKKCRQTMEKMETTNSFDWYFFGNLLELSALKQCISKIDVACSNAALMKIHTLVGTCLSQKRQQEIDGGGGSVYHHDMTSSCHQVKCSNVCSPIFGVQSGTFQRACHV